jgi:hypothetical protein
MILTVTITGADDNVDPYQLVHLSRFHPYVEWGVLFSEKRRGSARYPSFDWIRKLEDLAESTRWLPLSMHLCGAEARLATACEGELRPGTAWQRVQINGYEPGTAKADWRRSRFDASGFRWILQARSRETLSSVWEDALMADADVLYDPSGGEGKDPGSWPAMPGALRPELGDSAMGHGVRSGFAGGIHPGNIEAVLSEVLEKNTALQRVWIDMESGVRTDDKLDMGKVKDVLAVVSTVRKKFG